MKPKPDKANKSPALDNSPAGQDSRKQKFLNEEKAQRILREFSLVQSQRGVWEAHWQEIAERIWPGMSWQFNPNWVTTPGNKKTEFVFDSTASLALNRFGAIMDSLLSPRNQKWHGLAASNPALNKRRDVQLWFEEVTRILFHYRYAPNANFASQNQQNYRSLGAFGSGALFTDQFYGDIGLRYRAVSLGEIYFVENHQGLVDKAFRYITMTARQTFQRWGEKIPNAFKKALEIDPETIFHIVHLVEPNTERDPSRLDYKGMNFSSCYLTREDTMILEEGGYRTFPYAISRYEQYPREVYGRSPAMDVLPAIKTLNEEKKTILKQGHRAVDPILLVHDDGIIDGFSLRPGAMNAGGVTADGRPLVHALPTGNMVIGKELMDDERKLINDVFLVSLYQVLIDSPQMTATEVLERAKEKGILIAPTVGRQQSEYQGPLIDRELDLLAQQGALPPMPMALKEAKGEYRVIYDSPLSRAQKSEEASGVMRTIEQALSVSTQMQDPSLLDNFDFDVIIPEVAEIQGVPFHWMKSKDQIAQDRLARAKQQQQQQMVEAAPGAAAIINAGAKAKKAGLGSPGGM